MLFEEKETVEEVEEVEEIGEIEEEVEETEETEEVEEVGEIEEEVEETEETEEIDEIDEIEETGETGEIEEIEETEGILGIEEILEINDSWNLEAEIAITEDKEIKEDMSIPNYVLSEVSTSLKALEDMDISQLAEDTQMLTLEDISPETTGESIPYKLQSGSKTEFTEDEKFNQQQKEFLSGKVMLKDIVSEDGQVIIKTGDIINEQIINKAKSKGKLIEVIMNCK